MMPLDYLDNYDLKVCRIRQNDMRHRIRWIWAGDGYIVKVMGPETDPEYIQGETTRLFSLRDPTNPFGLWAFGVYFTLGKKKRWEMTSELSKIPLIQQNYFLNRAVTSYKVEDDRTLCHIIVPRDHIKRFSYDHKIREYHRIDISHSADLQDYINADEEDLQVVSQYANRIKEQDFVTTFDKREEDKSRKLPKRLRRKNIRTDSQPHLHEQYIFVEYTHSNSIHNQTRRPHPYEFCKEYKKFDKFLERRYYSNIVYDSLQKLWYSPDEGQLGLDIDRHEDYDIHLEVFHDLNKPREKILLADFINPCQLIPKMRSKSKKLQLDDWEYVNMPT